MYNLLATNKLQDRGTHRECGAGQVMEIGTDGTLLADSVDNLLVRIHFIMVMIRWTGLAPWGFEFSFPGSLTSTFLSTENVGRGR